LQCSVLQIKQAYAKQTRDEQVSSIGSIYEYPVSYF
jgi:hypothetical protein